MALRYLLAAGIWILWLLPFVRKQRGPREKAVVTDPVARWGMALQTVAILLVWSFPEPQIPLWRFGAGALFAALGTVTTWLSLKQLGRQWRLDAGLNAGHELVQDGPYAVVRHPLYAGTFAVMLSVGLLVTEWPVLICSAILYEIGTEIRMRSEDRLLRERFGAAFDEYASRVPGHIPFLK